MKTVTESGIYVRQFSRLVLNQHFNGVKKATKFWRIKENQDQNQVKFEILRVLFIFLVSCFALCVIVLNFEVVYHFVIRKVMVKKAFQLKKRQIFRLYTNNSKI